MLTISYLLAIPLLVSASIIPHVPHGDASVPAGPGNIHIPQRSIGDLLTHAPIPGGPLPRGFGGPSQCTTDKIMCCESLEDSHSPKVVKQLALVGVNADSISALTGWNCSPLGVGVAANTCQAQPACCTGAQFNALINLDCTPLAPTL